jgi:hypothetical protein
MMYMPPQTVLAMVKCIEEYGKLKSFKVTTGSTREDLLCFATSDAAVQGWEVHFILQFLLRDTLWHVVHGNGDDLVVTFCCTSVRSESGVIRVRTSYAPAAASMQPSPQYARVAECASAEQAGAVSVWGRGEPVFLGMLCDTSVPVKDFLFASQQCNHYAMIVYAMINQSHSKYSIAHVLPARSFRGTFNNASFIYSYENHDVTISVQIEPRAATSKLRVHLKSVEMDKYALPTGGEWSPYYGLRRVGAS